MKSTTLQIVCLMMILSGYLATGASAGDKTGNGFFEVESRERLQEGNDGPDGRSESTEEGVEEGVEEGPEKGAEKSAAEKSDGGNPHDGPAADAGRTMWAAGFGSKGGFTQSRGGNSGGDGLVSVQTYAQTYAQTQESILS